MFFRTRVAALGAVIAAATCAPVALASAAPTPLADPVITGPSCPPGYNGPTNLATGCPYWLMVYSVQYPGQAPLLCPAGLTPPPGVAAGSPGRAPEGCEVVA